MLRTASIGILSLALCGPAFAGKDSEQQQERPPLEFDFVAVVNVDTLDMALRERVGLEHVRGPVLLAQGELSDTFEGLYIRHVVLDPANGPLAAFRELGLVDERLWAEGMPAIGTDDIDVAVLADLASPGLPAEDLRAVIDTEFINDDALLKMPVSFTDAPVLALSTEAAAHDATSPVVSYRDLYYLVDPAAFAPEFEESIAPSPDSSDFVGLLCERSDKDRCIISDRLERNADVYIEWVPESDLTDDPVEGDSSEGGAPQGK